MNTSEFLLRIIGIGDAKYRLIWFMLAILLGLIGNMVVLISCSSPDTHSIHLFRVGSAELVDAAANLTDVSVNDLQINELPDHWYWGLSGMCAVYNRTNEALCKHAFPPSFSVEEMVSFAIETHLREGDGPSVLKRKMLPWTTALAQVKDELVMPSRLKALMQGAAALSLISTLISFALLPLTILYLTILRDQLRCWMLYIVAFLDAVAFLGAGVFVENAMEEGPRGLINLSGVSQEPGVRGPGSVALTLGVLIKFLAIELFLCLAFLGVVLVLWLVYVCLSICAEDRNKVKVKVKVINSVESSPYYQSKL
ncbi:Ff.00g006850.m01.CDS01 [Fusarium sp. VM40]|nr:Ff.00g006850.m01.CDS01 [Fusarium sp. VM40]